MDNLVDMLRLMMSMVIDVLQICFEVAQAAHHLPGARRGNQPGTMTGRGQRW